MAWESKSTKLLQQFLNCDEEIEILENTNNPFVKMQVQTCTMGIENEFPGTNTSKVERKVFWAYDRLNRFLTVIWEFIHPFTECYEGKLI